MVFETKKYYGIHIIFFNNRKTSFLQYFNNIKINLT
jgi:hypothetical protein